MAAKRKTPRRSAADLLGDDTPTQKEIARALREPFEGNGTYEHVEPFTDQAAAERFAVLALRDKQSFVMWWTKKGWRVGCPTEDIGRLTELIDVAEGA